MPRSAITTSRRHRLVHRAARAAAATCVLAATLVLTPVAGQRVAAAAPGPFDCQPGLYQVIAGQLKLFDPVSQTYTDIGATGAAYNAMGYSVEDDYLYALGTQAGVNQAHLLRIDREGTVTSLGVPIGLPVANYVSGDMDDAGNLIVRANATTLYSIDVSAGPPTATVITLTSGTIVGSDLVWIDGYLYSANLTSLYRVDLATRTATTAAVSGLTSGGFGAAWSDEPSNLYISDNNTGRISQISGFTGAGPSAVVRATATVTSNNDGAACKQASDPFAGPTTADDAYAATTDVALTVPAATGVLANDSGTDLAVTTTTPPSHGSLTVEADGSFVYTPDPGYVGSDSFTYAARDRFGRDTTTATASIEVSLPALPVADDDSYATGYGTALVVPSATGVLDGDTGAALTVDSATDPAHGTLSIAADGSFTFTPDPGFVGGDGFAYTACDPYGRCDTATVTLTVDPPAAPAADDDAYPATADTTLTVPAASGVLDGDTGTSTTITANTDPAHGTLSLGADGSLAYEPDPQWSGTDSFTYTLCDAWAQCDTATVTITVDLPPGPTAEDDTYSATADTTLVVPRTSGLLADDTGRDLTVTASTDPDHGAATVGPTGSFSYTPDPLWSGTDSFTYTVTDRYGRTATATAQVAVALPPAPTADGGSFSAPSPGVALSVGPGSGVLAGITGTGVTLTSWTQPSRGSVTVQPDGSFTYTPDPTFSGTDSFTYTVTDRYGRTATATVLLTVPLAVAPTPATTTTTAPTSSPVSAPVATPAARPAAATSVGTPPAPPGRPASPVAGPVGTLARTGTDAAGTALAALAVVVAGLVLIRSGRVLRHRA
jgi:hypothetical protein